MAELEIALEVIVELDHDYPLTDAEIERMYAMRERAVAALEAEFPEAYQIRALESFSVECWR